MCVCVKAVETKDVAAKKKILFYSVGNQENQTGFIYNGSLLSTRISPKTSIWLNSRKYQLSVEKQQLIA